jgi:glycosyltransferase involved in cell wall biosynthesis
MPKANISVIVACHNKENFLTELLQSVAHQTRKPAELIVVHDDCDSIASYDGVTTVFQRPHSGVAKIRDIGFSISKCPIVLFLDGDDIISPDYIEKALVKIDQGYDVVYSDLLMWYEYGVVDYKIDNRLVEINSVNPKTMMEYNKLIVSCPMKREVYESVGGFKEMPVFEDYDFWIKVMVKGYKFGKFESLFWYRQSFGTRNRQDKEIRQEMYKKITNKYQVINNKLMEKHEPAT